MRFYFVLAIFFCFAFITAKAQSISNKGFEVTIGSSNTLPDNWVYLPNAKADALKDSTMVHSGRYALKMIAQDSTSDVAGFHQVVRFNSVVPNRIVVQCWVKTVNCPKGVGIECSLLDSNGKELSFTNSYLQESKLTGTNDWTKMKLDVFTTPEVKQVDVTCYFNGAGTVWFDDAGIDEVKSNAPTAPKITAYVDSMVTFVKANAIVADSVNWKLLTQHLLSYAIGMQTYEEAKLLPPLVIDELRKHGDRHSTYMTAAKVNQFKTASIMGNGKKPEVRYLGNGIGYVSMPAFASISDSIRNSFAEESQSRIANLDREQMICGWVVDLREDNGGSAPPMIIGLGPVLGEGIYSSQTDEQGTTKYLYEKGAIKKQTNKQSPVTLTEVANAYKVKNPGAAVAVLIGKRCGSSGESTALAFVGRKDTKLFGQPTAGFTKGNTDYTLPDGSMLFISAGVSYDRNGKTYSDKIMPDVLLDEATAGSNDVVLTKATEWLSGAKKCQ